MEQPEQEGLEGLFHPSVAVLGRVEVLAFLGEAPPPREGKIIRRALRGARRARGEAKEGRRGGQPGTIGLWTWTGGPAPRGGSRRTSCRLSFSSLLAGRRPLQASDERIQTRICRASRSAGPGEKKKKKKLGATRSQAGQQHDDADRMLRNALKPRFSWRFLSPLKKVFFFLRPTSYYACRETFDDFLHRNVAKPIFCSKAEKLPGQSQRASS